MDHLRTTGLLHTPASCTHLHLGVWGRAYSTTPKHNSCTHLRRVGWGGLQRAPKLQDFLAPANVHGITATSALEESALHSEEVLESHERPINHTELAASFFAPWMLP